jgi:ribosomal protein L11 methyltransferase
VAKKALGPQHQMKEGITAIKIAPRVLLCTELPPNAAEGMLILKTIPSHAFGDGSHPTTRLSAGAVDQLCRTTKPSAVLDVGTGTGVLARIAAGRGAGRVVATDIDQVALVAARRNAALDPNQAAITVCDAAPDSFGSPFQLVVANIIEPVLLALAPALLRALAPGGVLLLSGFMVSQAPNVRAAFTALGLEPKLQAELDGWALLQLTRT